MPKYKLTEDGSAIVMKDGHPVVIGDDNNEFTIDALSANDKITAVTKESNERRKKLSEANAKLETYGDLDPDVANKAIQDMAGVGDKVKADLEAQRVSINTAWEAKQQEWQEKELKLNNELFDSNVGVNFATSETVGKTVLPPSIAKAAYSKYFKPDGTATDLNGNLIYSQENPGVAAGFDEALTTIINQDKNKDSIWKASGAGGSGGHNSNDGTGGEAQKSSIQNISEGLKAI